MPESFELWFDFSCPYAYLASRRAPALGLPVVWRPMLLGGVFRGIGAGAGPMATLSAAKAAHNLADMHRWAEQFGVPFRMPAAHPMRTVRALRVLLALPEAHWSAAIAAIYAAYWERGEDITRDTILEAALVGANVPREVVARALVDADSTRIKDELRQRTDEAIALGIFGAPAWILPRATPAPPLLVWGQDRFPWLEAIRAGWDPDDGPPPGGPRPLAPPPTIAAQQADFYFDVSSPFAYLALTQLAPIMAGAAAARLRLVPILLGGLFRDIGQQDVPLFAMTPPKQQYVSREMARWARWWGVPFTMPARFPQRTVAAQRLALVAAQHGTRAGLAVAHACGKAMWAEGRDLEARETLGEILDELGYDASWLALIDAPETKAQLAANTTAARAAGVFGVPTTIVDGHLFWGQDRLDHVVAALGGWKPVHG